MTVTQAQATKRGRVSVYADGEFLFAVEADAWRQSGLYEGCEANEQQLNGLLEQSRLLEAKRRALKLLSSRGYSRRELISRIAPKTGSAPAQAAAGRMCELGLIDDVRYAVSHARQLYDKGFAQLRIRFELQKRQLDGDAITQALDGLDFSEPERRAVEILEQRFGSLPDDASRRRAAAFLERCGYDYPEISFALRRLSPEEL